MKKFWSDECFVSMVDLLRVYLYHLKDLLKCLYFLFVCLILYVHSTIFQLCGTGLPGLNQY